MNAFEEAFRAMLADPTHGTDVVFDPRDGSPPLPSMRGLFAERPRSSPIRQPQDQQHVGPSVRVLRDGFTPTRKGCFAIKGRSFTAIHWDPGDDGSWMIALDEVGQ